MMSKVPKLKPKYNALEQRWIISSLTEDVALLVRDVLEDLVDPLGREHHLLLLGVLVHVLPLRGQVQALPLDVRLVPAAT